MSEVSAFRLHLLWAMYLFTALGFAIVKLPALLHPATLPPVDSWSVWLLAFGILLLVPRSVNQAPGVNPPCKATIRIQSVGGSNRGR